MTRVEKIKACLDQYDGGEITFIEFVHVVCSLQTIQDNIDYEKVTKDVDTIK